jgi:hypothetical protein
MEATEKVKQVVRNLFEARKVFTDSLDEVQDAVEIDIEDENNLQDIISELDEVILTIKQSYELDDFNIGD